MFDKEVLTLDHPAVQAAKAKWDARRSKEGDARRKQNISFEDWFEYFKANCIRMQALGEHAGVSRQRVQQIYTKHFQEIFGGRSGRERRAVG